MHRLAVLIAVLIALGATPAGANEKEPATLRIGVFSQSLTALVAESKGFTADQRLSIEYLPVTSSTQQFEDLRNGTYDLIATAPDNVANYRLNDSNPLGARLDVQAIGGQSYGQGLALVARPGIGAVDDLRGGTVAVDAPDSGFAYVLYRMLRERGLERDVDYEVVPVGGTFQRYQALLAGDFDATLLTGGFEFRAADAGFAILRTVEDVVPSYLGSVVAARERWLARHRRLAVRLVRAYQAASRWILDPANRDEAIALLMTTPNTSRAVAERLYELAVTPDVGVIPTLKVDRRALLAVLELRQEFGGFDAPQNLHRLASPASGLYDNSYAREAQRRD